MKKTIILLLTCILCAAIFTGCPHETQHEQEPEADKYPREFLFNKKEFDTQYKAWTDAGIKNYQFKEKFYYEGLSVSKTVIVKNGIMENVKYFDSDDVEIEYSNLKKNMKNNVFEWLWENSNIMTMDELFIYLSEWYEVARETNMKEEGLVRYGRTMEYDAIYHFPSYYSLSVMTEEEYTDAKNDIWSDGDEDWGWEARIYDFKVLD